jgi:UTP--glucose-1-phosphate uridylyltransferase
MKAIIIAAGYGTRFLPVTKTIPKEMLPLIDTPSIEFIINEFIESGIKDILIITSRRKKSLDDYFDREVELECFLKDKKDQENYNKIIPKDINLFFLRQKQMKGTGHAILICKDFIGNDPFIIAYPDDIVFSSIPLTKQLIDVYNKTHCNVLAAEEIKGDVSRYGVIDYVKENNQYKIKKIVEKPKAGLEPSKLISVGRYLFTPELLPILDKQYSKHTHGEFYHINSINALASDNKVFACKFQGDRIDTGEKIGYFEGIIRYGLERVDLRENVKKILKKYS